MTVNQIQEAGSLEALRFETAQKIRELLDDVSETAAKAGLNAQEFEDSILDLVMGER